MIDETITHYQITGKLGQGGMGEVYRATDTKLDREVAIKVLPKSFAEDATRLARFEREAKVLAALNHPNIAIIYGIEQSVEAQALIMELVEGETLGERLQREPMTVPEALDCCRQIAEALEAAHDKGIIHRDLKPENVKITPEGRVKVLDFGLAKEVVDPASSGNQAESPTITHMTTVPGELLGTAPYMSPEQARGRAVDKRGDIWSFGCVLYECLTGKPMFDGEDITETLATIIKGEPDWAALPEDTPPTIELLLRKCLNKDRKRRLHDIADARIDIEQALGDPSSSIIRLSNRVLQETTTRAGIKAILAVGAVVLVALVSIILTWFLKPERPVPLDLQRPVRRIVDIVTERPLRITDGSAVQFSPDGSRLAFMAAADDGSGRTQLYLRRLDQLQATPVTAAKAVDEFCFSPDGKWIAFRDYEENRLKKVGLAGGAATPLRKAEGAYGIDWSDDGWIVFSAATGGLFRVSENAGMPEVMTTLTGNDRTHRWPHVLPGGKSILFTAHWAQGGFRGAKIMFQRLPDGEAEVVATGGSNPLYLPCGYVVFSRDFTLLGMPFDPNVGPNGAEPVPLDGVLDGELVHNLYGAGHFDISSDGSLIYFRVPDIGFNLAWVNRAGQRETINIEGDTPLAFYWFALSPDGRSLVYNTFSGSRSDLWVYDIAGAGVPSRLTFGSSGGIFPVWSPGGKCIVYTEFSGYANTLYWKYADGSGEAQKLYESDSVTFPMAWQPDGSHLLLFAETRNGAGDVRLLELNGDDQSGWQAGQIKDFHPTPHSEFNGSFSPDGKWLAFDSDESGRRQVYVLSFPDLQDLRQISLPEHDAYNPIWSDSTNELLYMTQTHSLRPGQIYIVPYSVEGGSFVQKKPVPWPSGLTLSSNANQGGYALESGGKRLLVQTPADNEGMSQGDRLVLVEGFADELRKLLPTNEK